MTSNKEKSCGKAPGMVVWTGSPSPSMITVTAASASGRASFVLLPRDALAGESLPRESLAGEFLGGEVLAREVLLGEGSWCSSSWWSSAIVLGAPACEVSPAVTLEAPKELSAPSPVPGVGFLSGSSRAFFLGCWETSSSLHIKKQSVSCMLEAIKMNGSLGKSRARIEFSLFFFLFLTSSPGESNIPHVTFPGNSCLLVGGRCGWRGSI